MKRRLFDSQINNIGNLFILVCEQIRKRSDENAKTISGH